MIKPLKNNIIRFMISSFFYNIIIAPISNLLEFFYVFFSSVTSKGLSIIALSFVVTIFCLPLYIVAEKWQQIERDKQKSMESMLSRIKQTFTGDERYMMTNAYYRENHYSPIMALRSSFGLLIQIPFFIAAYAFLSNPEILEGSSFLFIRDMSKPDSILTIGSFSLNILPVAMTVINIIAGAIYTKGFKWKDKISIYGMALIFLVILYDSPSGLVLYWTMNNVLSLVKNIFYKLKKPGKTFHLCCCICLGLGVIWSFTTGKLIYIAVMILIFALTVFIFPILKGLNKILDKTFLILDEKPDVRTWLFILSAVCMAVLVGAVIPSFIMESEPRDFCYVDDNTSPFIFQIVPLFQAFGLYFFWPLCLYFLFSARIKKIFSLMSPVIFICALVNCFVFNGDYGPLNDDLTFMHEVVFPGFGSILINLTAMILCAALVLFLIQKNAKIMNYLCVILLLSCAAITIKNSVSINSSYSNMSHEAKDELKPVFHLAKKSTGQKNVLVIMQDRCLGPVVGDVFEEKPELKSEYDGFTYYPDTASMSYYTQLGVTGTFGGYDYTPWELNKRDETIQQKHNEAILTMPSLFTEAGYKVTVSDMPYENYGEEPVSQMYKDFPEIAHDYTKKMYTKFWYEQNGITPDPVLSELIKRNFAYLGLFKVVMPVLRPMVYHRNWWIQSGARMADKAFTDSYASLDMMNQLTETDSDKSNFIMLVNEITHEPRFLNHEDYSPFLKNPDGTRKFLSSKDITDELKGIEKIQNDDGTEETKKASPYSQVKTYHAVASAIMRWADFFDYLKKNDCYDNTRIIIVSDHGDGTDTKKFGPSGSNFEKLKFHKEEVTAALLVKDFDCHGELKTDNTFMTNADTPSIAVKGIVENAVNPFTKNQLEVPEDKKADAVKIAYAPVENMRIRYNHKYKVGKDQWYTVKDDIYKDENWSKIEGE